jgi:hypothetical protein
MSAPSSSAPASTTHKFCLMETVKPFLAPYYLAVAGALGAATVGFVVVIVLLILVAANFNVLSLIE